MLLLGISGTACSLKSAKSGAKLSLLLPNPHTYSQLNGPVHGLTAPTSWNSASFVCYGINVVGPGIQDSSSNPKPNPSIANLLAAGGTSCAYRGVIGGPVQFAATGATIDLQVPPGPSRVVQLVGITNSAYCAAGKFMDNDPTGAGPGAFELGRVTTDLFADASVSLAITYTVANSVDRRVDCGNGSSAATISPTVASALTWTNASPSNTAGSKNVTWTKATIANLADQKVQLYSDTACTVPSGSLIDLASSTATTYMFASLTNGSYAYTVTSIDTASNSAVSACSPPMIIDTVFPVAAAGPGWSQASPFNSRAVNATWTKSTSTDLTDQQIQYFSDNACTTLSSTIPLGPAATSYTWTAPSDGAWTYKIVSIDQANNQTPSACSSAMTIDTVMPTLAITTPAANSYVTIANQASFALNGTCSEFGAAVTITGAGTGSTTCASGTWSVNVNLSGATQGSLGLAVHHSDAAGNAANAAITLIKDTSAPTVAITSPPGGAYVNATNMASYTVTGTCSENGQNVVITGSATATVACTAGLTWTANLNFSAPADGALNINVNHSDAAGNPATQVSRSFTKDSVVPTFTTAPSFPVSSSPANPLLSNIVSVNWGTASETPAQSCILINDSNVAHCSWIGSTPPTYSLPIATLTSASIYFWIQDAAGNTSPSATASLSYIQDCDTMGGNGAAGSPWLIATPLQFYKCLPLRDTVANQYFKITGTPLNMGGPGMGSVTMTTMPAFQGHLDGNGGEIQSVSMSGAGIFQAVSGTITNLKIYSPMISCLGAGCGILAGSATGNAIFDRIVFTGATPATLTGGSYGDVGGLVGKAMGTVSFTNNVVTNLTLNTSFTTGGTAGVGGLIGTYMKSATGAAPADFFQNTVSNSHFGNCPTNGGGMIGYVGFTAASVPILIDQNSVNLTMACTASASQLGGLIGKVDYSTFSSAMLTVKNSNVQSSITGSGGGANGGGLIGQATVTSGTSQQLFMRTNYYGGTYSFPISPSGGMVGSVTAPISVTATDNVWNSTLASPLTVVVASGSVAVNTGNAPFGTTALTTTTTPFTNTGTADWTNNTIWKPPGLAIPKLAFEP